MDEMRTVDAPLVSIVVPVYNAERYLDRCVESILAQTLESIQVILVMAASRFARSGLPATGVSRW